MTIVHRSQVRFGDVDPAGIVFYPRFFEMLNAAVEDWFADFIGVDFATLHLERRIGVPTVRVESDFLAPCRLGEQIDVDLEVEELGRSSAKLRYTFYVDGEARVKGRSVLVCISLESYRSVPWPAELRKQMQPSKAA
jgi:4-hydroxybenzoyl-CoA thioesterase